VSDPTAAAWHGWHRPPRGRWAVVVTAATQDDAWRQLLALPAAGDKLVLPSGQEPGRRAAR
jgi:hypothetical protein